MRWYVKIKKKETELTKWIKQKNFYLYEKDHDIVEKRLADRIPTD